MACLDFDFCLACGFLHRPDVDNSISRMCNVCETNRSFYVRKNKNLLAANCVCEFCKGANFDLSNIIVEDVKIKQWKKDKDCAVSEEIREKWKKEQHMLKKKMVLEDSKEIRALLNNIGNQKSKQRHFIAGMDISFIKGDNVNACAALVVVDYPKLQVVYEDYEMIQLTAPYIPGFLAFREADFLVDLYKKLINSKPEFKPSVIFMDGNGLLHPREFGIACHVGVLINTPCLGVAKNLIHIDGLENDAVFKASKQRLTKGGDTMALTNSDGKILGMALRSLDSTTNPVYVSPGHLVSLPTAVKLVKACCKYRIPEPVRKADLNSREYLRKLEEKS